MNYDYVEISLPVCLILSDRVVNWDSFGTGLDRSSLSAAVLTSCDPGFVWPRRASPVTFDVCSVADWSLITDGEMCGLRMGPLADFDP